MRTESAPVPAGLPRLVVAGLSGESGKTLVSLALLLEARRRGIPAGAFKKGPDYIDAAWLAWASGAPARNLDSYLMGFQTAAQSFARNGATAGLNVLEGNRGLYDGADTRGTHSTAELAKALQAPVVLVLNATKITRTAAALVLGCQHLDPAADIAAVVINQVSGPRHERVIREAIESACHIPVAGAIPRAGGDAILPSRHLGLITPAEHPACGPLAQRLSDLVGRYLNFDLLLEIAQRAAALDVAPIPVSYSRSGRGLKIGYLRDSAFCFYYPENLEALEHAGVELVPISGLQAAALPCDLDALYIGGGFPETHAAALAANGPLLASIREAAQLGLPVYAECGGLMYLSRALTWRGRRYPMAGVLPLEVDVCEAPQGHGYADLLVDHSNPFFATGMRLKGHEFHYSKIVAASGDWATACAVVRGTGCYAGRDAIVRNHVWASYTHLHALATPEWAAGMVRAARAHSLGRQRLDRDLVDQSHQLVGVEGFLD